jgi:hypothetical protein
VALWSEAELGAARAWLTVEYAVDNKSPLRPKRTSVITPTG